MNDLIDKLNTMLKELKQNEEKLYTNYCDAIARLKAINKIVESNQTLRQKIEGIKPLAGCEPYTIKESNKESRLKPCPFCGHEAVIDDCGDHRYFVRCTHCSINQDKLYAQRCDAVRAWNRRVNIENILAAQPDNDMIHLQKEQAYLKGWEEGREALKQAMIRWVKTECNPYGKPTLDFESGKKVIEKLEQMRSAEPKTAVWIEEYDGYADGNVAIDFWYCSNCDYCYEDDGKPDWKYCPNCGAKMRDEEG